MNHLEILKKLPKLQIFSDKEYNLNISFRHNKFDDNIPIVFSTGPAGTGKTFLACHYAITSFLKGDIEKIIITRPTVSVDEDHGFLPGDLNDKMKPWLRPIYDIFEKYVSHTYMERLIKEESIEICPLAFMRGRTFENCVIIADEMQNSTESQMKMILTRISFGSKLIFTQGNKMREVEVLSMINLATKFELKCFKYLSFPFLPIFFLNLSSLLILRIFSDKSDKFL